LELSLPDPRIFVERLPARGESFRISGGELRHARARRIAAGDPVRLFDGSGREAAARVLRLSATAAEAVVEEIFETAGGPEAELTLLTAGVRAERLSWIVEKATELGVARVVLLRTERTQSFRASESLRGRLERVARAAAKQGGAGRWPPVEGPVPALEALAEERAAHRLLLDPEGEPFPGSLAAGSAAMAVGPEGGWARAELDAALRRGWTVSALPAGRLRAETAAVAGIVLLRAALARGQEK
jgi:16S rRNA (uracil1498-N3)-methyltransferase